MARSLLRSVAREALACLLLIQWIQYLGSSLLAQDRELDWTHFVRIGAYGLSTQNTAAIVQNAKASGVFGIEVDNDIPGRYESFVDPTEKLAAIRVVAD